MVFYFKARPEAGDYTIFMGLDKYENEELIKYGFPEDIWFHVDKMSSAHVYLRLRKGQTIDDISEGVLEDCVQLVKANSIQGNKVNNIDVVYTPWANLKKTASMDAGQVGFHNSKMVRTVRAEKRLNEVVNRLNKTKVERKPDLKAEREAVNAAERAERKLLLRDKVSSGTATFGMLFSSSMSVVEYYLLGRFPVPYALYFIAVAIVAAFIGQYIITKLITVSGRASLIIFVLAFTIFISAIALGGVGITSTIGKIERHEYMGFENLCRYTA